MFLDIWLPVLYRHFKCAHRFGYYCVMLSTDGSIMLLCIVLWLKIAFFLFYTKEYLKIRYATAWTNLLSLSARITFKEVFKDGLTSFAIFPSFAAQAAGIPSPRMGSYHMLRWMAHFISNGAGHYQTCQVTRSRVKKKIVSKLYHRHLMKYEIFGHYFLSLTWPLSAEHWVYSSCHVYHMLGSGEFTHNAQCYINSLITWMIWGISSWCLVAL